MKDDVKNILESSEEDTNIIGQAFIDDDNVLSDSDEYHMFHQHLEGDLENFSDDFFREIDNESLIYYYERNNFEL
jgi:hypothetical protein